MTIADSAVPLTTRHATLQDLAGLLREQKARKVDVVAPASAIRAEGGLIVLDDTVPHLTDDGVAMTAGAYRPTGVCDAGIADKLSIPAAYLRKTREQHPGLYDTNVNGWLERDADGNALSSVSDMHVMAWMLEQAGIEPGMSVLEIGSGGYNAALIAEVTGPADQVTTLDIDQWVTGRTRQFLDATGYKRVSVVLADAEHGAPDSAPYDVIVVTFGAWDVPPAWEQQLVPGGRLVLALRLLGLQRVIAFASATGTWPAWRPSSSGSSLRRARARTAPPSCPCGAGRSACGSMTRPRSTLTCWPGC